MHWWPPYRALETRVRLLEARDRERAQRIQRLLEATRRSPFHVLKTLDEELRTIDPAIDGVMLFVPSVDELASNYSTGARFEHYSSVRVRRSDTRHVVARAAAAGHALSLDDALTGVCVSDRHAVAIPLHGGDELLGVAYASSATEPIVARDHIVHACACAAPAYSMALEHERGRLQATYDGLTGLLTPRAFRATLAQRIEFARLRDGHQLNLWFIDTDNFKLVNDSLGHAAGDEVLRQMATIVRACLLDGSDVAGRNGGDEFCAVLEHVPKTRAIQQAQRFCEKVRAHDFGIEMRLTASIGVAAYPYDATTCTTLLELADAAMYWSKRAGRDRVSFALAAGRFCTYGDANDAESANRYA